MAGEIVIRFTGDASGLRSFYQGIASQTDQFVSRLSKSYQAQFRDILGLSTKSIPLFDNKGDFLRDKFGRQLFKQVGSDIGKMKVELDDFNDVLKVTAQTGILTRRGFMPTGENTIIRGSVKELNRLNEELDKLYNKRDRQRSRLAGIRDTIRTEAAAEIDPLKARQTAAAQRKAAAQYLRDSLDDQIAQRAAYAASLPRPLSGAAATAFNTRTANLINDRAAAQRELNNASAQYARIGERLATVEGGYATALSRTDDILRRSDARRRPLITGLRGQRDALYADPNVALPKGYQTIQNLSPSLLGQLTKAGLPKTGEDLYKRKAQFSAPVRDLVTGVTQLSGAFEDNNGIMQRWHAEIDRNGKLVTRFGGNLSGLSRITEQISRNFQKVIEWTVATTVVFGALTAGIQALDILKTLDADLTRFGVTANLTAKQTKEFYNSLFEVAQATATPIEELVKAADDFALAISKPGQTVQELTKDITTLAEAVGIYTNLTGDDTVEATDLLVSTMKQLGLTTQEVFVIMNKITAVAGGQSGAIADITKGLSVMAEAGEQANLTVNQQIGVIKTLSQVTSKSPAEIATAFKNLVGALENPAALKALSKYNIGLISEGKSIIDIYTQISEKISTGEIAPNDVSGLLRAISGGPRRAPDAAALLANINQVLKETRIAQEATNEAFIANAQILDTLEAKYVQFQNTLKDKIFREFGESFKQVAITGIELITSLLEAFSRIPSEFFTLGAQLLAFATAFSILSRLGKTVISAFAGMSAAVLGFTKSTALGNTSLFTFTNTLENTATKLQRLKAAAGSAALGGFIGGIAGVATGQNPGQIAGSVLQGAGFGLLAVPSPDPYTKIGGAALFAAGAIVQMASETKESNELTDEQAKLTIQTYQAAKQAAAQHKALGDDLGALNAQIDAYHEKSSLTIDDQIKLVELQKQASITALEMGDSYNQLGESLKQLKDIFPELADDINELTFLNLAGLNEEIDRVLEKLLDIEFPGGAPGGRVPFPDLVGSGEGQRGRLITGSLPEYAAPTIDFSITGRNDFVTNLEDLAKRGTGALGALENANKENVLRDIIESIEQGNPAIILASSNLSLLKEAISNVANPEFQAWANGVVNSIERENDALTKVVYLLDLYKSTIDKIALINPELGAELTNQADLINDLIKAGFANLPEDAATRLADDLLTQLATALNNRELIPEEIFEQDIRKLAEITDLQGYNNATEAERKGILDGIRETYHQITDELILQAKISDELLENNEKIKSSFDDFISGSIDTAATDSAKATIDFKDENIKKPEFNKIIADSEATITALRRVKKAFDALYESAQTNGVDLSLPLKDLPGVADEYIHSLEEINGLQDVAGLSTDQLIVKLFNLADIYRLNGKGVEELQRKIVNFINAVRTAQDLKIKFGIDVDALGIKKTIALLKAVRAVLYVVGVASSIFTGVNGNLGQVAAIDAQIAALETISGFGNSVQNTIDRYSGTGSGGSGGGSRGSKAKQGKDVSTLDLPEEIANAVNRDALIREAIRRARALQGKIPGENKEARNDIVELLKGTQRILEVRGVKDDYLRKALEELAAIEKKRLEQEQKADTIRRIRVGSGDFAAIANVPVNSRTGVSVGGPNGPINVTLNLNGTVLTPAQFAQFADMIAASIKRQLAG